MYSLYQHAKRRLLLWKRERKSKLFLSSVKVHGKGIRINGTIFCSGTWNLELGNNVHINDNAYFRAEGGLMIGDNAHLSRNLTIYTVNHNYTGRALPYDSELIYKPVSIEKNVWIGMNVCIIPGIHIAEGAIIGMGAVVCKDVPKGAIVGGNPAKILKFRDMEHYHTLDSKRLYGGVDGAILNLFAG